MGFGGLFLCIPLIFCHICVKQMSYCMNRGLYLGFTIAILGWIGLSQHPKLMKDIETVVQSHWGLISAVLLSSFIWKFILRRVVHSGSLNIQNSKARK